MNTSAGRKQLTLLMIGCVCCFFQGWAKSPVGKTETEDIARGEQAILTSLAAAASPKSALLCTERPIVCVGPEKWELGLSLLAARDTSASLRSLASLVRYQLDGGISEEYDALVIGKGKIIEPYLAGLSTVKLHQKCQKEFAEMMEANGSALGELKEGMVCRSPEQMSSEVTSTLDAIRHSHKSEY